MKRNYQWLLMSAAFVAACSPTQIPLPDAGPDAAADARPDARPDAAMEASADVVSVDASDVQSQPDADAAVTMDAAPDALPDAAPDALPDALPDAIADSAPDALPDAIADSAPDASPDAAPDASADAAPDASPDAGPPASTRELWMVRVGDGVGTLSGTSAPAFIERRSSADGSMAGATIALPVAMSGANFPVSLGGTGTTEGVLIRSADGRFVTMGAYGVAPGAATVSSSVAPMTPRVAVRINAAGVVDSSTAFDAAFSAGSLRSVATVDGTAFWGVGSNSGLQYQTLGTTTTPVQVISTPTNIRVLGIFAGQLYFASGSSPFTTVVAAGTGTPTMAGATASVAMGLTTTGGGPNGFAFFDLDPMVAGVDTLYIGDDRGTSGGGGIQRWTSDGTTWTLAATITGGLTGGVRSLTAWADGTAISLVAVTTENPSRVISYVDRPGMLPAMPTVLATAAANTQYRGVAIAPTM